MERVYVGNLPPDIRIKDIDDFFRPFGKLVYIDVNHRTNPVYAYVQFDSARNAFNAVKSRHGYDYEGYTLQLRLVENEVRRRRDATPPPPPPPMLSEFLNNSQNNRGGYNNDFGNNYNNNRMGGNFPNSSFQSGSSSQWSSNNRSNMSQQQQQNMSQYPTNNRVIMPQQTMMDHQQNMMPYSSNGRSNGQQNPKSNRSNMQQNNNSNRSNMPQNMNSNRSNMPQNMNSNRSNMQQNMNSNRSNMQQNTNSNRLNVQQQYSNSNRSNTQNMNNYSNMSQQNMNNYSNNSQQNMNNYSNVNRSNMSQQQQNMNMMNYSNNNNSSWNSGNDNMGWNSGNNISGGNNYNNAAPNNMYNANNDPYATAGFEDSFTHGLSGSGRKWFNRYIRKGFSPELARSKALEHRTVPYLREDPTSVNPIPNDPTTNMALETIGNTILSLLSTNPGDNFNTENQMMQSFSNWGGDNFQAGNFDMQGPSSSRGRGNMVPQIPAAGGQPRNRVSKQQYLKSVDILKKLKGKSVSAKDRVSRKYHTQIVKDYEEFEKSSSANNRGSRTLSNPRNDRQIADGKSYSQLSIALRKKKQQLFLAARRMRIEPKGRYGGAYKKRMKILMNDCGFSELEAKALAVHPMEKLGDLMALKVEYDNASKKKPTSVSLTKPVGNKNMKSAAYRNDVNYIRMYEKQKLDNLSPRIKSAIRACLVRIHKHEKEAKLPLTKSKLTKLLPSKTEQKPKTTTTATQKKQDENKKTTTTSKKTVVENKPKVAPTNTKKVAEKKDKEPPTTTKDEQNTKENADITEVKHEDAAENAEQHEE